jgi:hypothetical protein
MGKVNVKNGTPVGSAHLCRTCANGQFTTGYRETDVLVICASSEPARLVPFAVHECTAYWDRNRPSYAQMQKFALNFIQERRKPVKGFSVTRLKAAPAKDEADGEDQQKDEAARTR